MKRFVILATFIACACTPPASEAPPQAPVHTLPATDAAGNRMEALTDNGAGRLCSGDGVWCVGADGSVMQGTQSRGTIELASDSEHAVWPVIVRQGRSVENETVLVGLQDTQTQAYSGGGGSATAVTLYEVSPSRSEPTAVLTWPLNGSATVRACFTEEAAAARQQACADTYDFDGVLTLDSANASGPARLILTTEAATAPGRRTRSSDSTTQPPLSESDLAPARDDTCSYRRIATYDAATSAYAFDEPLPACSDYLEP